MREAGNRSVEELAHEENEVLVGLLKLRAAHNGGKTPAESPRFAAAAS